MKNLLRVALLVSAIGLGGCHSIDNLLMGDSIASQFPGKVSIQVEKSLTIAHLAYNGISEVILTATRSGTLRGENAKQVWVYYRQAGDALNAADKAHSALNEEGIINAIMAANDAIAAASVLVRSN
jgi:hypothetical protein